MRSSTIQSLLSRGTALYTFLEQDVLDFRIEILWADAEQIVAFERRRQETITAIQNIDTELNAVLSDARNPDSSDVILLKEYDSMRKLVIPRVLALDKVLLECAVEMLQAITGQLNALNSGKDAIRGYAEGYDQELLPVRLQA